MLCLDHWIAGVRDHGSSDRAGTVYNPATGEASAEVPFATAADVDRAVAAALNAFEGWSRTGLNKRATILFAFRELVRQNADDLARLIVREHGKVLADARGEVQRGLEVVEFACGIPQLLKGEFSENVSTGVDSYSLRQPLGVVAGVHGTDLTQLSGARVEPNEIDAVGATAFSVRPDVEELGVAESQCRHAEETQRGRGEKIASRLLELIRHPSLGNGSVRF